VVLKTLFVIIALLASLAPGCRQSDRERHITKAEFGTAWPFSVDEGIVKCLPLGAGAVVFETGGKTYAVNGIARGFARSHGFLAIDAIWLQDPHFLEMAKQIAASKNEPVVKVLEEMGTPTRISIQPILDTGVSLCR
jgi:hypothetical protein